MQRVEYQCDNCLTLFGTQDHIRIKSINLMLSYKATDAITSDWMCDKIIEGGKELHFCHPKCMADYVGKKLAEPRSTPILNQGLNKQWAVDVAKQWYAGGSNAA